MSNTLTAKKKSASLPPLTLGRSERNMGVELLRVVSMIMVICLHILGQGGVRGNTEPLSGGYNVANFMYVIAFCSVNCYALISGFANVKTEFKFRRIVYLWLETAFLLTAANAVMHFFVPSMTIKKAYWLNGLFPLTRRELWYFCAYFFMFPLIPILNKGILSLKKWQHVAVMLMLQGSHLGNH